MKFFSNSQSTVFTGIFFICKNNLFSGFNLVKKDGKNEKKSLRKLFQTYRQTSNIRCTLVGNKIVDHSDVVGATPVGAALTPSSFST